MLSRITLLAPATRIDVALPADVPVADLLPMVLSLANEVAPDGGSRHRGWVLAKLGGPAIDPSRTLGSLGILDGDQLQLRRRGDDPPPPLFDDVAEAIAVSAPSSHLPWTERTARIAGQLACVLALAAVAVAAYLAGPGVDAAVTAGAGALVALVGGTVLARSYGRSAAATALCAGAIPLAFVAGLYTVPDGPAAENLAFACVLAGAVGAAALMLTGSGVVVFVSAATAGLLGGGAGLAAALIDDQDAGVAAGAAAVAVGVLSLLPRATVHLSRLPLPRVPVNADDLADDELTATPDTLRRTTGTAHEYLTAMVIGCGAVAAVGAAVSASEHNVAGWAFGPIVAAVLLLRARSYGNSWQTISLLVAGAGAAGGTLGVWMAQASETWLLIVGCGGSAVLAGLALVLGVAMPGQRFSPPMRRFVDIVEAVLIASVLPVALAVMDVYDTMREL